MVWHRYARELRWIIIFATLSIGATMLSYLWATVRGVGDSVTLASMILLGSRIGAGAFAIYAFTSLAANVTAQPVRTLATVVTLLITVGTALEQSGHGRSADSWTPAWFHTPLDFARLMFAARSMSASSAGLGIATALIVAGGLLLVTTRWVEKHDF